MSLTQFHVDDGQHAMDGLRLFARDGTEPVEAFIGRKVMDVWAESIEHLGGRQSLFRNEYNALGKIGSETDQLGRRTEYAYDDAGNLITPPPATPCRATARACP